MSALPSTQTFPPGSRTKLDFPTPGSSKAPKKFKGDYDEIDSFLKTFVALANAYNLTTDDRFELIVMHVSKSVRELIHALKEYWDTTNRDWNTFEAKLRQAYNAEKVEMRYKEKHLLIFIAKTRHIHTLEEFHTYLRRFMRIGGWLLQKKKISDNDLNKHFWKGIPKATRKQLEHRMLQTDSNLNRSVPYTIDNVIKAADHIFDLTKFYDDDSDITTEPNVDSDSSGTESDGEVTDSEEERSKKKKKTVPKAKKPKKKTKVEVPHPNSSAPTTPTPVTPDNFKPMSDARKAEIDEVTELINRLGRMSLDDPSYAGLYFRITQRSPSAASLLRKPGVPSSQPNPNPFSSPSSRPSTIDRGPFECFYCGEKGHGTRHCQHAENMIASKTIVRNEQGRLIWPDGSNIIRNGAETIQDAVNRELGRRNQERPASTNVIMSAGTLSYSYDLKYPDDPDTDEEAAIVNAAQSYPVTRPREERRAERKKVTFDGVHIPPRPKPTISSNPPPAPHPTPASTPQPPRVSPPSVPPIRPFDTPHARFDPNDDDEIMEDATQPEPLKRKFKPTITSKPMDPNSVKLPPPSPPYIAKLRSQAQRDVDPQKMFEKIKSTPITVTLADLFGAAPEMSKRLLDYVKLTRPALVTEMSAYTNKIDYPEMQSDNETYSITGLKDKEDRLIELLVKFDNGLSLNALIDPGSQIDVMSEDACRKTQSFVDRTTGIKMKDASQNITMLQGRCREIRLWLGDNPTVTDFWVGGNIPYDIVLGRPWQRRNRIGIDERRTGTWLTKRDDYERKEWDICIIPADSSIDHTHVKESYFFGQDMTQIPLIEEEPLISTAEDPPNQET